MKKTHREAVAYHEAGHAVVAFWLWLRPRHASIIPKEGSEGHVLERMLGKRTRLQIEFADRFHTSRLQAEKRVMVAMAGVLAQRRFNPRSVRRYHGQSDREAVVEFLSQYAPWRTGKLSVRGPNGKKVTVRQWQDMSSHEKLLSDWTKDLLDLRWYSVEAVAKALLEKKQLSYEDIRVTIVEAGDRLAEEREKRRNALRAKTA